LEFAILQSDSYRQDQQQTSDLKKKTHVSYDFAQALQIQVLLDQRDTILFFF